MANFALIGGSGLDQLSLLEGKVIEKIDTPYGKEPVEICRGVIDGLNIVFYLGTERLRKSRLI